jgi:hypothetical protein
VAQAGHKGEGHRVCKVGADDADGRQPRIEKEEHGHAQGAGTYRAQRHKHAEHAPEMGLRRYKFFTDDLARF